MLAGINLYRVRVKNLPGLVTIKILQWKITVMTSVNAPFITGLH